MNRSLRMMVLVGEGFECLRHDFSQTMTTFSSLYVDSSYYTIFRVCDGRILQREAMVLTLRESSKVLLCVKNSQKLLIGLHPLFLSQLPTTLLPPHVSG